MIDKELQTNLYILISLALFFIEREILVDIIFMLISFCLSFS